MAELDAGLNIEVNAKANKKSAETAAQELEKSVISSLKDGYIEIPTEIKAPIKGASKELKQAQQDVLTQWKKTFSEGFSSSSQDMDELIKKYQKFKRLAKGKLGEDQTQWITKNIGTQISTYKRELKKAKEASVAKRTTEFEKTKQHKTNTKSNKKQKGYIDTGAKITNENKEGDIRAHQKRQLKGIKQVLPNGYGSGWINPGRTNEYEGKKSELSFYASGMNKQFLDSQREARKTFEKESLVSDKYATKEELEAEVKKRQEEDKKTATHYIEGRNKNNISSIEEAKGISDSIRSNILPQLIDKIKVSTEDAEIEKLTQKFFDALDTVSKYSVDAGKLILSDVKQTLGIVMKESGFATSGLIGGIDAEEGTDKTAISRDPKIEALIKGLLDKVAEKEDAIKQELIKLEQLEKHNTRSKTSKEANSFANRIIANLSGVANNTKDTANKTSELKNVEDKQNAGDAMDYTREQMEATKLQDIEQENASTGTDSEQGKNEVIEAINNQGKEKSTRKDNKSKDISSVLKQLQMLFTQGYIGKNSAIGNASLSLNDAMCPCQDILSQIAQSAKNLEVNVGNILQGLISMGAKIPNNLPTLIEGEGVRTHPQEKEPFVDKTNYDWIHNEKLKREQEEERNATIRKNNEDRAVADRADKQKLYEDLFGKNGLQDAVNSVKNVQIPLSEIIASSFQRPSVLDSIKKAFGASAKGSNAESISKMSQPELEKLRAERISKFGLTKEDKAGATGDVSTAYRRKSVYGWDKQGDSNPFKDLKLSDSLKIDTTDITSSLQDVIQKNQFNAQSGGVMRNIIGSMTGYLGMPSLEKTRAQADGLNAIMAEIRKAAQDILQNIQSKETDLRGMQQSGQAVFNDDGTMNMDKSSKEAISLFGNLEEQKMALRGVLADAAMVDNVVQSTGGNVNQILQQLGFAAPELRKCNTILQNLNAGLDKSGKALKFQTRTAEVLNYSFQLMARSVGQMIKRWLLMLNPINLIKRAFQDFASYDVKWQRTMNVIKYNIRRIIKPFMQWLAQQIVNVIGLVNALLKGIGKVFGKNWDLFDQAAASTEKMEEDFEKINNAAAGFDELHDISSASGESDPANDLLGDIYTPQWDGLNKILEKIGESIGKIIKAVSNWTFWDWLKLAGAALLGFLALRALINWFRKGKNPLQSVADGFKTLEKAVGWAALIWAFSQFVKALTDFVDCMKTADWDDIIKTLLTLAGAFDILVGSIVIMMEVAKKTGTNAGQLFGLAALVGVFDAFVMALIPFLKMVKELEETGKEWKILGEAALTLVGAFAIMVGAVWAIQKTLAKGIDWSSLLGLSAVVLVFSAFTDALIPFINCIKDLGEERFDVIITAIVGLVGAFLSLALGVGVITQAFKTMDWSSVGKLATLVGVFTLFTYALIPFINAVKDIPADELMIKLAGLAAVFIALGLAIGVMSVAMQSISWTAVAGMAVALLGMAAITWTLSELAKALKDLSEGQIYAGLMLLAGGLLAIAVAIGVLAVIFTAVVSTGIGALAVLLLALILGMVALIIEAMADFVTALGEAGAGIQLICEGVAVALTALLEGLALVFLAIGEVICNIVTTVADSIATVVQAIADGITNVLTPILEFMGIVMETIGQLAATVAHEIGETIRTIIETVGKVITDIIKAILDSIPKLSNAILNFIGGIGPAIEKTVNSIIRTVTKLVNFMVSAIEYLVNLAVDGVNGVVESINGLSQYVGITLPRAHTVSIRRFVPKYEQGTNYVPNDGLAYLHQGEAVVPKKYNTPYQTGMSDEEKIYMRQMIEIMRALDSTMKEGISVNGQFVQKGSDLVAVVNRTNSQTGANLISNVSYAR